MKKDLKTRRGVPAENQGIPEEAIEKTIEVRERLAPTVENPLSPYGIAVSLKREMKVRRVGYYATLQKGVYPIVNESGTLGVVNFDEEGILKAMEAAKAQGSYHETEKDGITVGTTTGEPVELKLKMTVEPLRPEGEGITYFEVLVNLALEEAKTDEERELIIRAFFTAPPGEEEEKGRRAPVSNEHVLLTTTKAESAMFNPNDQDHIWASDYDGRPITIGTGKGAGIQLALAFDSELLDFDSMTMAERVEQQLTGEDRFWLRGLQSIVYDNPEETRVYGTDLLKKLGWKNPYKPESHATLAAAMASLRKMRVVTVAIDTTNEQGAYKRNRGKVIRSIQERPIVDGLITVEEVETDEGKRVKDFHIDLRPTNGKDATDALPTLTYALDKGQLITADSDIFVFDQVKDSKGKVVAPAVPSLGVKHRMMADYIYTQVMSRGTSNVVLYSTMFKALGFEMDKHAKSRAHKKVAQMLENWKARGIISGWAEKMDGRRLAGVVVEPPRKAMR